jgi:hypothetical protein
MSPLPSQVVEGKLSAGLNLPGIETAQNCGLRSRARFPANGVILGSSGLGRLSTAWQKSMGRNAVSLPSDMTPYVSATASGYDGTMSVKVNEDSPVLQRRVLSEDHLDGMQPASEFVLHKNEDIPEEEDLPEEEEDEDPWDERMEPDVMPHGHLSRQVSCNIRSLYGIAFSYGVRDEIACLHYDPDHRLMLGRGKAWPSQAASDYSAVHNRSATSCQHGIALVSVVAADAGHALAQAAVSAGKCSRRRSSNFSRV